MVSSADVAEDGRARITVLLTVPGCPMKEQLTREVTAAVSRLDGITGVDVNLGVMTDAQRGRLQQQLRGDAPANEIPFAQRGLSVGVLDADIYGFSVPRMLGVTGRPTQVEQMMMPPVAHDVKVISIGMFTPGNSAVVWRGPMLHRALQQFLADVFWGELDILLMDLPPGTGDIAISVAQLVPSAELLVVTTPQLAAREVAERAGSIALQTHQQIVGVVENMSWLELPDGTRMELFGSGGGQAVADSLAASTGTRVPLLGQVPIDQHVREGGDEGVPVVLSDPDSQAAQAYRSVADALAERQHSLVGRSLGLSAAPH